jgi:hypothetical protein
MGTFPAIDGFVLQLKQRLRQPWQALPKAATAE